jgi:hypothetical protein
VPHPFLTPEWLAAAREVYERLAPEAGELQPARINQTVTDVPFGDGEVQGHVDTTSGALVIDEGHLPEAKVSITLDYETARALLVDQDPAAVLQAFMAGKIRVQGDMAELLRLQSALAVEQLHGAAAAIRAITELPEPPADATA